MADQEKEILEEEMEQDLSDAEELKEEETEDEERLRPTVRQLPHRSIGCGHRNSADDVYPCAVYCICGERRGSARGCGRADCRCKI